MDRSKKKLKRRRKRIKKLRESLALFDFTPESKAIGKKFRQIREALGYSQAEFAVHLGCNYNTLKDIESLKIRPTNQLAMRFVWWCWGHGSWKDCPTLAIEGRQVKKQVARISVPFYDYDLYQRMRKTCVEMNCSGAAFIKVAVERLLNSEPTIVTIRQAVRAAEELRLQSIFEQNPAFIQILEGDPLAAKLIHDTTPIQPMQHHEEHPFGIAKVNSWNPEHDGPSRKAVIAGWVGKLTKV